MKKKKEFDLPYIGVEANPDYDILYGKYGEFSIIIKFRNPVLSYSGSANEYNEAHGIFLNIVKVLGENVFIQKMDVISRTQYVYEPADEFLQDEYNRHFEGRSFLKIESYLTITRKVKRGAFYVYDKKAVVDFKQAVGKVIDILDHAGCKPKTLREREINLLVKRTVNADFHSPVITMDNIIPSDHDIKIGERLIKCISLIDIDTVDLPSQLPTHVELNENSSIVGFPVDLFSFLLKVPDFDTIIFNQVIEVPGQMMTLNKLELKKKRHSGIPDPANIIAGEDIELLLRDVAKDNQLLVNCHFNIVLSTDKNSIQKASNFIETCLFQYGITVSKHSYNQLQLFRSVLPGNATEIEHYDLFLTTVDAALCLFFKEALAIDEVSKFKIRFTDRQGVPICIDPADLPMAQNRISNRNKFVLGPSGSGKSFFMNGLIEQYMLYNMDVVIVDTGHSYSGLCSYYNGKYITYSDKTPITMNPFAVTEEELNIEKKDFINTLICLLWKGADGDIRQVERDVISHTISSYYTSYFNKHVSTDSPELSFNSFYEFCLIKIPEIKSEEGINFDLDEFRFVLKKFYRGGTYDTILNEAAEQSLFTEKFIVFEIDSIKEHKILFPIVTLIIMDVFIQKMRNRKLYRKALIIEEAWKAIASPLMAGYILYLYKTVRKFWGEAIVVTQELGDIIGNTIVKDSIINNSDTICLLDQTNFKDNFTEIGSLLSITPIEKAKIFTVNKLDNTSGRSRFKEVYIRRGSTGEVYGVEVSLAQYLTYTTEKPEKSAVETYVHLHNNHYPTGLKHFIRDFRESGYSLHDFVSTVNAGTNQMNLLTA
jgi:conjugation system TraG family ATPase